MRCPFLRENRVKYCQASPYRKMIVESSTVLAEERCSSQAWSACAAAAARRDEAPDHADKCPFLHEANVEFCAAASVTKYIPASDSLLSHCTSDAHFYCELYLMRADPQGTRLPKRSALNCIVGDEPALIDDIPVMPNLWYAPNHMWVDVAEDGYCHTGVDAFFARTIGAADAVSFAGSRSTDRPVALIRMAGCEMQMVIPTPMHRLSPNAYLRTSPGKLTSDPYGSGWLFEGFEPALRGIRAGEVARAGLISGDDAIDWMRSEASRLDAFVHEQSAQASTDGTRAMADGGIAAGGVVRQLDHEGVAALYNEFFAPHLSWRRQR